MKIFNSNLVLALALAAGAPLAADPALARFVNNTPNAYRLKAHHDATRQADKRIVVTRQELLAGGGSRLVPTSLQTQLGLGNPSVDVPPFSTTFITYPEGAGPATMTFQVLELPRNAGQQPKFVGCLDYATSETQAGEREVQLRAVLDGFVAQERVAPGDLILNAAPEEQDMKRRMQDLFRAAGDLVDGKANAAGSVNPAECILM